MTQLMDAKNVYLAEFERFERNLSTGERAALHHVRQAALARFDELGFPSLRDEDWRFTNLAALTGLPFQLGGDASVEDLDLPAGLRLGVCELRALRPTPARNLSVNW